MPQFQPSGIYEASVQLSRDKEFNALVSLLSMNSTTMNLFLLLWGQRRMNNPQEWDQVWFESRDDYRYIPDGLKAVNELFPVLIDLRDKRAIHSYQAWSHYKGQLVQWLLVRKLEQQRIESCSVSQTAIDELGDIIGFSNPFANSKGNHTFHTEIDIVQILEIEGRTIEAKSNTSCPLSTNMRRELYGELNLGIRVHSELEWTELPCLGGLADNEDLIDMLDDLERYCSKPDIDLQFDQSHFDQVSWYG